MIDKLDRKPWRIQKRVLPQHTDHAGVMWHGAYLNWLEEARVEALNQVGLPYKNLSEEGYEMPVISLEINYKSPLLHGQLVWLESWSLPRNRARWPWMTNFLRNGEVVAESKVDLVLVKNIDKKHRLIRNVPDHILSPLLKLQFGE
ncbi:acyl-CoA thioesterase [Prochlorococcus sp. MIT 1307]|uniref:acyl-CoA thioesterase n=1 Tax=Prochlorococcus sp. MIT 1307 TaxID=3096219 RepID=UPI002A765847|nr:acyl-CoA thioesterase [Prochlorococcus sp. MIT 1307]